jgi:hypothetical protein
MLSRLWQFVRGLDLDSKLTIVSLTLVFVAWITDYIRSPQSANQLLIPLIILLMLSCFLLLLAESMKAQRRFERMIRDQQDKADAFLKEQRSLLRDQFPRALADAVRAREDLVRMGITMIRSGRDDERFVELLKSSNSEICLMAISLYHYVSIMRAILPMLLGSKVSLKIKILIAHPDSASIKEKEREEQIANRIRTEIEGVDGMIRRIRVEARKNGYTGSMEVRQYYGTTYCSLYIFDDETALYNPYLRATPGKTLPVLEMTKASDGIFGIYRRYFQTVWDDSTTVVLQDGSA